MGWASDTYADLTRQQYQDWKKRFYPQLKKMMDYAAGDRLLSDQLSRADRHTQNSLRSALSGQVNQMARYGAPAARDPQDNSLGLRTALAHAGAKNSIRGAAEDRQLNILTGGSAGVREQMRVGGST
ncbi:hypothetical protein [Edwardsiella piscicida]|uniref:hypothetical protein n=1 Tax=Edwardsiella piscicida TaxID=1263550 RepID=UPI00084BE177|nr:hypothetical protein [Edwardsiella piscicida]AOP42947.1 hypothetical protein A9797_07950 [Edwardsiella piscicida]EKS7767198.1 hypothetical protein [Edwardsiella piscicida]EKS7811638.1 hypothetical protein [Edwardsiella piscicida]ELM3734850.1 hypothetical protein [Edwardsiella piscicida]QBB14145.1 hypothetical protein EVK84_17165 [Edwardsiella piscicida]